MTDALAGVLLACSFVRLYAPPKTIHNALIAAALLCTAAALMFTSGGAR